jgi:hypothetical protein
VTLKAEIETTTTRTHTTTKTTKQSHSVMLFVALANLSLESFLNEALMALDIPNLVENRSVLLFTYFYKGQV